MFQVRLDYAERAEYTIFLTTLSGPWDLSQISFEGAAVSLVPAEGIEPTA